MISTLSAWIAVYIKKAAPDSPESIEVLKYVISFLINTFSVIIFSLLISIFTHKISETLVVLVSYAILRQMSGGIHLKSGLACIIVSTVGIAFISISDFNRFWMDILSIFSLLITLLFAPSRIDKQTRIPTRYYPHLKVLSSLLVSTGFIINSPAMVVAFFVQSLTLIPARR